MDVLKAKQNGNPQGGLRKLLAVVMCCVAAAALFAQEVRPVRSWYVSAGGKDDNTGRSPDTAFETFGKAFSSAAASNVKTITVVGAIQGYARNFSGNFPGEGTGEAEILVTGMDENAVVNSNIRLGGSKPSKIRIERLRFGYADHTAGRIEAHGNITLTIGRDTAFDFANDYLSGALLEIKGGVTLIMEGNAALRAGKGGVAAKGGAAVDLANSVFIMKDDTQIGGFGIGVLAGGASSVTLRDNAKITGCDGRANLIIQDSVRISGNEAQEGGGIYALRGGSFYTLSFTSANDYYEGNNSFYNQILTASVQLLTQPFTGITMTGGTISGNKADYGAGVYAVEAHEVDLLKVDTSELLRDPSRRQKFSGYTTVIKPTGRKSVAAAFTHTGGSITGNEAQFVGGGVYAKTAEAFSQDAGALSGNSAGDGEGEDRYTP
jgi:hypothetical protein